MGSLNDFWNSSIRANEFLRSGVVNDTVRNADDIDTFGTTGSNSGGLDTGASCVSTSQCPSGWGCVNGVCQQLNNGLSGGSSSPGGGGDCDPGNPESPCNSGGPDSCQQTPQCGDTAEEARDCCGTRCCSFGSASSPRPGVHCWCGECPPWPGCTEFCENYLKAYGEVGPGCTEGTSGNSCNSCSECNGGLCEELPTGVAPCWCEGSECNGEGCESCDIDNESDDFGECAFEADSCQDCATIINHQCPCGVVLSPVKACKPYGEGGLLAINLAQQEAYRRCTEACDGQANPCLPVIDGKTYCTDTGTGVASCPEGSKQTGFLDTGGEQCVFCQTEDYSGLPDSCKECDCNCHDDCPDCQICSINGTCVDDPTCSVCFENPNGPDAECLYLDAPGYTPGCSRTGTNIRILEQYQAIGYQFCTYTSDQVPDGALNNGPQGVFGTWRVTCCDKTDIDRCSPYIP